MLSKFHGEDTLKGGSRPGVYGTHVQSGRRFYKKSGQGSRDCTLHVNKLIADVVHEEG